MAKPNVPDDVLISWSVIEEYLWHDEEKDYRGRDDADESHIFLHLLDVHNYFYGENLKAEDYKDEAEEESEEEEDDGEEKPDLAALMTQIKNTKKPIA